MKETQPKPELHKIALRLPDPMSFVVHQVEKHPYAFWGLIGLIGLYAADEGAITQDLYETELGAALSVLASIIIVAGRLTHQEGIKN